jgi:DNA helicase-2/ATP-dependent DNA helicase PcrA
LITTYTNENLRQLERRIAEVEGTVPPNVHLMGWFTFLLSQGIRPYQTAWFPRPGHVRGLNFVATQRPRVKREHPRYFLDTNNDVWRDWASDLVCRIDEASGSAVIRRLEDIYDHVFVDEVQDLVGYDLDVLDLLFAAKFDVTVVGDPRQHLFATNNNRRNTKYRGPGLIDWFAERARVCERDDRHVSYRCNQGICDFASALFPDYPAIHAASNDVTRHDGIHEVSRFDVLEYAEKHRPQVLRPDKRMDTQGLPAMNFGISKGSTFDRVLIFPTNPMLAYLKHLDPSQLKRPATLYVAVTRARHSVAFVV